MNFVEAMTAAQTGYDAWAAKPHNAKWAKMIYHTPIPNDLLVNIAEAFCAASRSMTPTSAPAVTEAELIERLRGPVFGTPTALDAATAIETWKARAERMADMHRDMCVVAGEATARAEAVEAERDELKASRDRSLEKLIDTARKLDAAESALASLSLPPPGEGAEHRDQKMGRAAQASPEGVPCGGVSHQDQVTAPTELINRLQDAVEGECEGLAIDEDQARAILEHVGYPSTPAAPELAVKAGWQTVDTAPHACHVLATRFDQDFGEWVIGVVMSPPSHPFTHWRMLPEPPSASPQQGEKP